MPQATAETIYSPVSLSNDISRVGRLCLVSLFSFLGTILNGYFVASFFVEKSFRKKCNVYLCCLGLADMLITTVVMPISAVVLLSGEWDNVNVCSFLQFMTELSTYSYSMFAMLVAVENYSRYCCSKTTYKFFLAYPIGLFVIIIFIVSGILSSIGVYYKLDYDYCERKHIGNTNYRKISNFFFHFLPCVITLFGLISSGLSIQSKARISAFYKRSEAYRRDSSLTTLNTFNYIIFLMSWSPYLILVNINPEASDSLFYNIIWVALLRSVLTAFFYGACNTEFRHAFVHIYKYCFCKSSLYSPVPRRHRRANRNRSANGQARTHLMHHVMASANLLSPYTEISEL